MGVPDHLIYLQRNLYSMWDRKHQLELDVEQLIGSKLGKEYNKAAYCLPECSLEGQILKLRLQYFGHLMRSQSQEGNESGE